MEHLVLFDGWAVCDCEAARDLLNQCPRLKRLTFAGGNNEMLAQEEGQWPNIEQVGALGRLPDDFFLRALIATTPNATSLKFSPERLCYWTNPLPMDDFLPTERLVCHNKGARLHGGWKVAARSVNLRWLGVEDEMAKLSAMMTFLITGP